MKPPVPSRLVDGNFPIQAICHSLRRHLFLFEVFFSKLFQTSLWGNNFLSTCFHLKTHADSHPCSTQNKFAFVFNLSAFTLSPYLMVKSNRHYLAPCYFIHHFGFKFGQSNLFFCDLKFSGLGQAKNLFFVAFSWTEHVFFLPKTFCDLASVPRRGNIWQNKALISVLLGILVPFKNCVSEIKPPNVSFF